MHGTQIENLLTLLIQEADPKTKNWWAAYVKNSAPFLGVKMAGIRSAVHQWHEANVSDILTLDQQSDLARALVLERHTEEKLAGMLMLQEILIPKGAIECTDYIDRFAELFNSQGIYDWNVCDWFCIKVLGPLIEQEGRECATAVSAWRSADDLWQACASLVPFVSVASNAAYYPLIAKSCSVLIRREERFAKTAVGWIMRAVSKHDVGFVRNLLDDQIEFFSVESLKKATKYFTKGDQKAYQLQLKRARRA